MTEERLTRVCVDVDNVTFRLGLPASFRPPPPAVPGQSSSFASALDAGHMDVAVFAPGGARFPHGGLVIDGGATLLVTTTATARDDRVVDATASVPEPGQV